MKNIKQSNLEEEKIRFTTLINPNYLTQIKLVSYLTNKKLFECINDSINLYVKDFELTNNTSIQNIINLQTTNNVKDDITNIEFE
jgi:hypothetical protein